MHALIVRYVVHSHFFLADLRTFVPFRFLQHVSSSLKRLTNMMVRCGYASDVTWIQGALMENKSSYSLHRILNILRENVRKNPPLVWTFAVFNELHRPIESRKALLQFTGAINQQVRSADEDQRPGPRRREGEKGSRDERIRGWNPRVTHVYARHPLAPRHSQDVFINLRLGVLAHAIMHLNGVWCKRNDAAG